jgi:hypothetical protein
MEFMDLSLQLVFPKAKTRSLPVVPSLVAALLVYLDAKTPFRRKKATR